MRSSHAIIDIAIHDSGWGFEIKRRPGQGKNSLQVPDLQSLILISSDYHALQAHLINKKTRLLINTFTQFMALMVNLTHRTSKTLAALSLHCHGYGVCSAAFRH